MTQIALYRTRQFIALLWGLIFAMSLTIVVISFSFESYAHTIEDLGLSRPIMAVLLLASIVEFSRAVLRLRIARNLLGSKKSERVKSSTPLNTLRARSQQHIITLFISKRYKTFVFAIGNEWSMARPKAEFISQIEGLVRSSPGHVAINAVVDGVQTYAYAASLIDVVENSRSGIVYVHLIPCLSAARAKDARNCLNAAYHGKEGLRAFAHDAYTDTRDLDQIKSHLQAFVATQFGENIPIRSTQTPEISRVSKPKRANMRSGSAIDQVDRTPGRLVPTNAYSSVAVLARPTISSIPLVCTLIVLLALAIMTSLTFISWLLENNNTMPILETPNPASSSVKDPPDPYDPDPYDTEAWRRHGREF